MKGVLEAVREWFDARSRAWLSVEGADGVWSSVDPAGALDIRRRAAMQKHRGAVDRKVITDISVHIMERNGRSREDCVTAKITEMIRFLYELNGRVEQEQRVCLHHQIWRVHQGYAVDLVDRWQEGEAAVSDWEQGSVDRKAGASWTDRRVEGAHSVGRSAPTAGFSGNRDHRYDRTRAVRYAELWWDRYNPDYSHFDQDCTNFVSQALYAGGLPMIHTGKKETGWWYHHGKHPDFSYSWTVANALAAMLQSAAGGIRVEIVANPAELQTGDIIQYDWNGTGRYGHTTIVTDHDSRGDPLVNAHTASSRKRHYAYEDSDAWTPKTRYLLCRLED